MTELEWAWQELGWCFLGGIAPCSSRYSAKTVTTTDLQRLGP